LSFKEHYGCGDVFLPRLATGFGGGIARKGSVCGAVVGSVMVIGMRFGRTSSKDKESAAKVYEKVRRFLDEFEKEFGTSLCYTLTGCHFDDPAESEKWKAAGGIKKCSDIVEKSSRILYEIVEKE
jgi:C_GCAxxG_C_C family probable redox protein